MLLLLQELMFPMDSQKIFELHNYWSDKIGYRAARGVILQAREMLGLLTSNPASVPGIPVRHQNGGKSRSGMSFSGKGWDSATQIIWGWSWGNLALRGRLLLPFLALLKRRIKISQDCEQGRGKGKIKV